MALPSSPDTPDHIPVLLISISLSSADSLLHNADKPASIRRYDADQWANVPLKKEKPKYLWYPGWKLQSS